MQAGSQLRLTTKHDTYGISFAWPASDPNLPTEQPIDQSENADIASSIPGPSGAGARDECVRNASAGETTSSCHSTLNSAGRIVDAHDASDRRMHEPNSSANGDGNQGSGPMSAGHRSKNLQSQQGEVPFPSSGTRRAGGVPLMVRRLPVACQTIAAVRSEEKPDRWCKVLLACWPKTTLCWHSFVMGRPH